MNPADLGYYEKTPGSGLWYNPVTGNAYRLGNCLGCGREILGQCAWSRGRYCSPECSKRKNTVGYCQRHKRVGQVRGKASNYFCVDCGKVADDWSQTHGTSGYDPQDYEPRCTPCHRAYDRETIARGERNGYSKLTESIVRDIRSAKGISGAELARIYGVHPGTISKIRLGQSWQHVKLQTPIVYSRSPE